MIYRAWRGPANALVPVTGYLGGTIRITSEPYNAAEALLTLPTFTAVATTDVPHVWQSAVAAVLPKLRAQSNAWLPPGYAATAALSLPALMFAGDAVVPAPIETTADLSLPGMHTAASTFVGQPTWTATSADLALPGLALNADSESSVPVFSTEPVLILPALDAASIGENDSPGYTGTAVLALPALTGSASAAMVDDSYVKHAQTLGAVLIWNQDRDGNTWHDESGNGLDGTAVNNPIWSAVGGPGEHVPGYWRFNGTSQYLTAGDDALLRLQEHTLVWWERTGDENGQGDLLATRIGKGDRAYAVRRLDIDSNMRYYVRTSDNVERTANIEVKEGDVWQLWMMVYDPDGAAPRIRAYVIDDEGDSVEMTNDMRDAITLDENADEFGIGAQSYDSGWRRHFRGDIAGVLVFDIALSASDHEDLYDASMGAGPVPPPPPPTRLSTTDAVLSPLTSSASAFSGDGAVAALSLPALTLEATTTMAEAGGYVDEAKDLGAVLIWNQERSGGEWKDESGNDLHGTEVGSPTWSATGGPGGDIPGYYAFNGTSQAVTRADTATLHLQSHTLVWWERADGQTNLLATRIGKNDDWAVRRLDADGERYYVRGTTGESTLEVSIETGAWRPLFARYKRDGASSFLSIHSVDGSGDITELASETRPDRELYERASAFAVGARDTEGTLDRWFEGDIAGVVLFNKVLTLTEMQDLYDAAGID